jgi:hypothetical protein
MAMIETHEILASSYTLADNTFTAKEDSFAAVEVGDAKQPDAFYPQVKIMRWDNECNFSARLVHKEVSPKVTLVADKIQWIGDAVEAHFYEIGEGKEGGGFEFEIILKEPPKSNVVTITLQTKGLDFFYQPELTPEEIARGVLQPENAIGSYAVYHKTMAGDYTTLGGKNYLAGKAFHIYRPRIEDAEGNWVWGVLNIDEKAGLLTVTIPQDFLDKAVYPVRHAAGLTFGYTSIGVGEENDWDNLFVTKAASIPASNGNITSISLHGRLGGDKTGAVALYSEVAGLPSARLAYLNSGGPTWSTTSAWYSADLSCAITAGTQYWLGFGYYGTGVRTYFNYDAVPFDVPHAAGTWPDPWTSTNKYTNRKVSVYATYTAAAAAGQATAKRFGGVPHMAINKGVW